MRASPLVLAGIAAALLMPMPASAGTLLGDPPSGTYTPSVPVSAFARPAAWLDPSRLHVSTSVSVGSGFGGTQALQVTSLHYQFQAPLWMSVSLGNAWGSGAASRKGSAFLEGLDIGFRPSASMLFQLRYRDLRSPLQLSPDHRFYDWAR